MWGWKVCIILCINSEHVVMLQRAQRVLNTITDQNMSSMNIVAEDNEAAIEEGEAQDNSGTASVDEGRVRALVIDNQIQGMVLKVRILTGQIVFFLFP
jgi:hypothetical protein